MPIRPTCLGLMRAPHNSSAGSAGLGAALDREQDLAMRTDGWLVLVPRSPLSLPGQAHGVPSPQWGQSSRPLPAQSPQMRVRVPVATQLRELLHRAMW